MICVHRIPYSTNVERVALAAGHKGIEVEWVDHDPADRRALVDFSGQELVPAAEIEGEVVVDSMRIVEVLEAVKPKPALYPAELSERAGVNVFVEWFNLVWKGPPNELNDELGKPEPDETTVDALTARTHGWMPLFFETPPDDVETFHPVLERCLKPAHAYPLLCDWVERVDALPRA